MSDLAQEEMELREQMFKDKELFMERCMKIRTKTDGIKPLILNSAQRIVHQEAEKQLAERGFVRIIVLKARQEGITTYIQARAYHTITHDYGQRAYILTHEGESTRNIFEMVQRYHKNNNPLLKPSTDKDTQNELHFNQIDSGYKVGTAGTLETGRGQTIQFFHGSEVAFWNNAEKHARAAMQGVPPNSGEIWLESTSDGMGNYFYKMCMDALQGRSEFQLVFIPWFIMDEYREEAPKDFIISDEEERYLTKLQAAGHKLTKEQLMFRRKKIIELDGEENFAREYPATIEDAFMVSANKQLIPSDLISEAMVKKNLQPVGVAYLGVDPARFGDDYTVVYYRKGRYAKMLHRQQGMGDNEKIGLIKNILDRYHIDLCNVDIANGTGIVDMLNEWGYDQVKAVNFGAGAYQSDRYTNRRNEMYGELHAWMKDGPVEIEYDEMTYMDLAAQIYTYDSKGRKALVAKDKIKEEIGRSPDNSDALALTFAENIADIEYEEYQHHGRSGVTGY